MFYTLQGCVMHGTVKICLADLAHTYSVSDRSLPIPLGIGYIKAYVVEAFGDKVDIRLFKHPERFLKAVHAERPQIVGFANYGWSENLNREIGRYVRRLLPDALIVAGGPNIDPSQDRRLAFMKRHDYLDFLIIDGGEEPFTELTQWHLDGSRDLDRLPSNVVWRDGDRLYETPERPLKKIIEHLPSPYLSGHLDEFLAAEMIPLLETNRGCPFRCTFCAWGSASKDLVRRIDLDQSLAEIAYVGARSNARNWIICDANFGILQRDIEIAKAIRAEKDAKGTPTVCHIWLAKNTTDRNLAISEIMGDMIEPCMAVQSLDDAVLKHIKRDNISLETYEKYQQKFHRIGSRTYSDLIVPLPAETLSTHLKALRKLMDLGVDIIVNHNMRFLAGAETNSQETRERFKFRTSYRLIHGDAGEYQTPDGSTIRAFEYEESLRATDTMSEADLFYLRKLHFLVDFCWNIDVYKPMLSLGQLYGLSPIDLLVSLLDSDKLASFFAEFDRQSMAEWFDSQDAINGYFGQPDNWRRLLNREFEKLNIQFSVIALRDYKVAFDAAVAETIRSSDLVPEDVLSEVAKVTFAFFPPLNEIPSQQQIRIPNNLFSLDGSNARHFRLAQERRNVHLSETISRGRLRSIIASANGSTLSKILNTQGISLRELRMAVSDDFRFDHAFRRAV